MNGFILGHPAPGCYRRMVGDGGRMLHHVITGPVPVILTREARRFHQSGRPGLIPGSSPGTAMTLECHPRFSAFQ
jgi:hypothetical protein